MKSFKKRLLRRTGSRGLVSLLFLTLVLGVVNYFTKQNDKQLVEVIKKPASLAHLAHADTTGSTDSDGGDGADGGSDSDGGSGSDGSSGTAEGNGDTCG